MAFETLTSYIQSVITGELCERRHIVGVIRQNVGLLCNAPGCLLDALIVCVLRRKNKAGMKFVFTSHSTWTSKPISDLP